MTPNESRKLVARDVQYAQLPMSFEANYGQEPREVRFASHGNGYGLYLTARGAVLTLRKAAQCDVEEDRPKVGTKHSSIAYRAELSGLPGRCSERKSNGADILRMTVVEGNPATLPEGAEPLPGIANYFIGNDPAKWHANVRTYAKVRYPGVYPGVDLLYYGHQGNLEYDFVVAPGASVRQIRIRFDGAKQLQLNAEGALQIRTAGGEIAFHRPLVYQLIGDKRKTVEGRFTLLANQTAGFVVGKYDQSQPLVIDPQLAYSTYLGGSISDSASGIAVDASGAAYVVGTTTSLNFPTTSGSFQPTPPWNVYLSSQPTAFVTKLSSDGGTLVYSTYLGGSNVGGGYGQAIALDSSGSAYVTGYTYSATFPVTTGAFQTTNHNFGPNAFVSKLNSTGSGLVYSTYLGGSGNPNNPGSFLYNAGDEGFGIAIDAGGNAYVTGTSYSPDFPVTGNAYQPSNKAFALNENNVFVSKLNSTGTALSYSTYLGGSSYDTPPQDFCCGTGDTGLGLTVDTSDNAYVVGFTASSDFPVTTNAFQTTNKTVNGPNGQGYTGFVSKVSTTGAGLNYSTYLGGTNSSGGGENFGSIVRAIAIDVAGEAYLAGNSGSPDFPVTSNAYQATNNEIGLGYFTGIVAKLNATGTDLLFATYLGGSGGGGDSYSKDIAEGIAIDSAGDAYVVGHTYSSNFPVTSGAYQGANNASSLGQDNAFVTELNPSGSALVYSTYFGGTGGDAASVADSVITTYGIALDSSRNVYFAGATLATDFPISAGAYQTLNKSIYGTGNAFVAKIALGLPSGTPTTTTLTSSANPQTVNLQVTFQAVVAPSTGSGIPTGDVAFSVDGSTAYTGSLDATGTAIFSTDTLTQGTHTIVAVYAGDSTYDSSRSNNLTEAIYGFTPVPVFSPSPGTYVQAATVTITDSLPGATIYYTTDGTTPTTSSKVYYGLPMKVTSNETIKAIANGSMYSNSAVATANYAIQPLLGTMTFSPAATEPFGTSQIITISNTLTYSGVQPTGAVAYVLNGVSYTATCTTAGSPETCSVTVPATAIAALPVAAYTVTGSFAGDANYAPATAATGIFTVTGATASATTIALTSSPNSSIVGQAVTFTATVTNSAAAPTGSVTFVDGTTVIGTATLIPGGGHSSTAILMTSSLAVGTHPITATYAAASTGAPHADTFAWTNWTQDTPGNTTPGSASGTLASTIFGTINVTYSGQTSGLATQPSWGPASTFSGGIVGNAPPANNGLALEGGYPYTETITFSKPVTDPAFAIWSLGSPSVSAYFNFTAAEPFNLVGGGPSNEYGGQSIVVAGTAIYGSEGNGIVQFIGTYSSLTFTTPDYENYYALTVGEDQTLTDNRVTSSILNQVVISVAATVFGTMTFSPAAIEPYGTSQPITITDTLSYSGPRPTGAVAYVQNGVRYTAACTTAGSPETCTATVPAATIAALPVAVYTVSGSFAGDANYTPATASSGTFTITKAQPVFGTMTFSPAATEPYGTNQIVTISDTLTYSGVQPTGAVAYVLNGVSYLATCTGTMSPETCTATVPAATINVLPASAYPVTGSFVGDSNYVGATATSGTFTITQAAQTVTFNPATPVTYGVAPITLSATGGASGNPVTFAYISGPGLLSGTNNVTLTVTGAGNIVVKACQAGNANYAAAACATRTIVVNLAVLTVRANNLSMPYGGPIPALTYGITGYVNGDGSGVVGGTAKLTTVAIVTSPVLAGGYPITFVTENLTASNYTFVYVPGTLTVNQAPQTITFNPATPVTYGVMPVTLSATGGASGNPITFSYVSGPGSLSGTNNGKLTVTGAGNIALMACQAGNGNYAAAPCVTKTIVADRAVLAVTATSLSLPFGDPIPTLTYGISGFVNNDPSSVVSGTATLTTTATVTSPAGSSYPITFATEALKTANYTFTYIPGNLTVDRADVAVGLASSATSIPAGSPFTLTANVRSTTAGTPTGKVMFFNGTALLSTVPLVNGVATYSTELFALENATFTATFAGDTDFLPGKSNALTVDVLPATTATALSASLNPAPFGATVTFTATVSSLAGVPLGNVSFYDGAKLLEPSNLTSGVAKFSSSSLADGSHNITAVYGGAQGFAPSTSKAVVEQIVDFSVSASPSSRSVYTGEPASYTVTITPISGFNLPVVLSCSQLPANTTCNFTPSRVPDGNGIFALIVQTTAPSEAKTAFLVSPGYRVVALASLLLIIIPRSLRRSHKGWLLLAFIAILASGTAIIGCSNSRSLTGGTPVGTYTISVTGTTTNGSQSVSHNTALTLNVRSLF